MKYAAVQFLLDLIGFAQRLSEMLDIFF
jgi:hypothetical protein